MQAETGTLDRQFDETTREILERATRGRLSRRPNYSNSQTQPSSFMAIPECQIFVMCLILSPSKSMTYT